MEQLQEAVVDAEDRAGGRGRRGVWDAVEGVKVSSQNLRNGYST